MKYGLHLFATETSIQPAEFAMAAEERGFESVWFSEHTHIPFNFLNAGGANENFQIITGRPTILSSLPRWQLALQIRSKSVPACRLS